VYANVRECSQRFAKSSTDLASHLISGGFATSRQQRVNLRGDIYRLIALGDSALRAESLLFGHVAEECRQIQEAMTSQGAGAARRRVLGEER
jgi:hypothetical protein